MLKEKEKMALITQISLDINEVKDLDMLLERILTHARRFFNADAGSIYLKHGDNLQFSYTQNDTLQKRMGPNRKLVFNTYLIPVNNQSIAGYVAANCRTVNIPDVYNMSGSEPYEFDAEFDRLSNYRTSSVLTVPRTNQQDVVLGVMQIINARDDYGKNIAFSHSDETLIKHFATSAALAIERAQMTRNVIMRMISMAELRDPNETGAHVNRVASCSVEIYEQWAQNKGMPFNEIERQKDILRMASMLHDVGKVAISDLILKKPEGLTHDEYELMKMHSYLGARLFRNPQSEFEQVAGEVALTHHEKWDGTGYPGHIDPMSGKHIPGFNAGNGKPLPKKGEEIPVFGRIVAVADVYDALSSPRCYKEVWDEDRTLEEMRNNSGKHFDPEVVDAFFSRLDVIKSIAERYPEATG
ncbi:MAG: phosphohydrolase [Deltaproteobacteria bacterium]|nr:MAG: phosphohydrolase [Deltaproteobacteria bacterium]